MVCLFVDFSLRENGRQTKVLQKKPFVPFGTVFTHPGKVQRRFAHFNSFRFSDTEASFLYFMLFHEQRQVLEIQILNLYLKVFFRLLCLGDLGPLYPGTKAPELQQIMVAYVPCCTAQQSLCTHRRTETQKYIPGPFWSSLSFCTIYVPLWRLYDISAFFIDSQE